jgi:hypothetical protein
MKMSFVVPRSGATRNLHLLPGELQIPSLGSGWQTENIRGNLNGIERLVEVGNNVLNVFNAH